MANWGELPLDIWKKIAESIEFYEDFDTFRKVCSDWRKASKYAQRTKSSTQTPWLLLSELPCTSKRRFYSLYNHKVLTIELSNRDDYDDMSLNLLFPGDKDKDGIGDWRYYSSRGWLICVTQIGLNVTLINPVSNKIIRPPSLPGHIVGPNSTSWPWRPKSYIYMLDKFIFSENPSTNDDFVLAVIFPSNVDLAFWKSGDKEWTMPDPAVSRYSHFIDITFYKGEFYAVEQFGKIIAVGNSSPPAKPRLVANLMRRLTFSSTSYLVESAGKLLYVFRQLEDSETLKLKDFKVWEINEDTGETREVKCLGNRALFLGHNSSFSVEACPPTTKPNCIYYTDNYCHNHLLSPRRRCSMGVYDLSLGQKIEEFYHGPSYLSSSTLPLWVESPN